MKTWPHGSGEMVERIRSHDWSASPLGPPDSWPKALKAAVDPMLPHGFAMMLLWGPERISIYNDAYLPMMLDRHPGTLGRPLYQMWLEMRDLNEPFVGRALSGETIHQKTSDTRMRSQAQLRTHGTTPRSALCMTKQGTRLRFS